MVQAESTRPNPREEMYGSGVASLIGNSGISLDGQSLQLPDETGFDDVQDDISSINESSYYRGIDGAAQMKIVGTVESMEEGNADGQRLTRSAIAAAGMKATSPAAGDIHQALSAAIPLDNMGEKEKTPPNMSNTRKLGITSTTNRGWGNKKGGDCLPNWVSAAPRWLKFVIVLSIAMLVGAVVLVTVALTTALADQTDTTTSNSAATGQFPSENAGATGNPPVMPSVPTIFSQPSIPAPAPTLALPGKKPSPSDTDEPTSAPTPDSEVDDALLPEEPEQETAEESEEETPEDLEEVKPYDEFVTTFFVTGGRFTNDALDQIPDQLKTLPVRGGTSFMVHLGDWNSPYATRCDQQSYQDVNDLYSNSSIPVYFVPGDNDFNDCPDPQDAMSLWHDNLLDYETQHWHAPHAWNVTRDAIDEYPENFAFVYNEILFIGINLVGGVVHDENEWATRQAANLQWIDDNYQKHKGSIRAFALFAHADPDVPSNSPFYEPFKEMVKKEYNQIPVVLIHRNLGVEPWSWETDYENIDNFSVIVVAGSVWPPLMGAVDFRQENPFVFDQSNWYDEYIEHQVYNERV